MFNSMLTPNSISSYYFKPGAMTPYVDSTTNRILPIIGARTHTPLIDSSGRWLLPSLIPFFYFTAAPKFIGTGEDYNQWIYREDGLPGPSPLVRNALEPTRWHYFVLNTSGSTWTISPNTTETRSEYSQVRSATGVNSYGYTTERTTYQASLESVYTSNTSPWIFALLQQWHQLTTGEDSTIEPIQPIDPANGTLPMLKTSRETACGSNSFIDTAHGPVEIELSGYIINTIDHTSHLRASASGSGYTFSGSSSSGTYQSSETSQHLFGYLGRRGGSASFVLTGSITIPKTFSNMDGDTLYTIAASGRVFLQVYRSTNHSATTSTSDKENAIATIAHTFALERTLQLIAFETELNKPSSNTSFTLPGELSLELVANTPYLFRVAVEGSPIASETTIEDTSAQLPLDGSASISTSSHLQLPTILRLELNFK